MKLTSRTIDLPSQSEFDLMDKVASDFAKMTKCYSNFYSTLFFHELNRKIIVKISYGKIIEIDIEKLDIDEE